MSLAFLLGYIIFSSLYSLKAAKDAYESGQAIETKCDFFSDQSFFNPVIEVKISDEESIFGFCEFKAINGRGLPCALYKKDGKVVMVVCDCEVIVSSSMARQLSGNSD